MQNVTFWDLQVTGAADGMANRSNGLLAAEHHAIKMIQHGLGNSFSDQPNFAIGLFFGGLIGQPLVRGVKQTVEFLKVLGEELIGIIHCCKSPERTNLHLPKARKINGAGFDSWVNPMG